MLATSLVEGPLFACRKPLHRSSPRVSAVICVIIAFVVAACGSSVETTTKETHPEAGSQRRSEGFVLVAGMVIPAGGGFVGVYEDVSGAPGLRIGQTAKLPEGLSSKLRIAVAGDEPVWVMVHHDANHDGRLEFPGPDVVVTNGSTGAVNTKLLKVAEGSSADTQGGRP